MTLHSQPIWIDGRERVVSLERSFWTALAQIARRRGVSSQGLIAEINADRRRHKLPTAIRIFVLEHV